MERNGIRRALFRHHRQTSRDRNFHAITGDLVAWPIRHILARIVMSVMQRREGVIEHVVSDEPTLRYPLGLVE
jgi:hypothetical protein